MLHRKERAVASVVAALRKLDTSDRRAAETADELVEALWRQAAATARFELSEPGTPERTDAQQEIDELDAWISGLQKTLRERPWTEA